MTSAIMKLLICSVTICCLIQGFQLLPNTIVRSTSSLSLNQNPDDFELTPSAPSINIKRGIAQGGAFLGLGLLITGENPLQSLMPVQAAGKYPIVGDESIMKKKEYGTGGAAVQKELRWGCDSKTADRICNFNRAWAEYAGYWTTTNFFKEVDRTTETTFYDSITGKALFVAPKGRTFEEFENESRIHGWPSFRDEEVVWENVRTLKDGETVSITGTHLGHNLPDRQGNRYCINLVSVSGKPQTAS